MSTRRDVARKRILRQSYVSNPDAPIQPLVGPAALPYWMDTEKGAQIYPHPLDIFSLITEVQNYLNSKAQGNAPLNLLSRPR